MYSASLIRELVQYFAEAASVSHEINVFTDPDLFERWKRRRGKLTPQEREHLDKGFAISFFRATTPHEVYINTPRHVSLADLTDTVAHEVAHLRWWHLNHGRTFDRRVIALLAGYRCGSKSERLPDSFK